MKRKTQVGLASGEMTEDLREPCAEIEVVAGDSGLGEFAVEIGDELGGVTEFNRADSFFGGSEKDLAEVALAYRVADSESFAAITIGEWGHAKLWRGLFVDTAGRRVSGSIQGMSDIGALLQLMLEGLQAQRIGVFARSHAQQFLKAAQEMRRAERDGRGEIGQRGRLFGRVDQLAGGDDFGSGGIGFVRLRTATLAGTESGALGGGGIGEELDTVTLRASAWARGSAVNAGRAHGIDKGAVET